MQIKDLISLLEQYNENDEVICMAIIDGSDYALDIKGVGTIEDDDVIYVYAKDE
ncbi:hypothetical protein [Anaerococcus sp. AGMB09787]|uniref:hypothetical protein n=1 Tax=Anaerococcus sp. AGMB09787 TaxID=2922869 RepID=UPI001FB04370|nr:hypothetical protein [Anaerococcus sp. AGMB09787]